MREHSFGLSRRVLIGVCTAVVVAIIAVCTLAFNPVTAHAVTAAEKQAEAAAVLDNINAMQEKLDIASADYYTALDAQAAAQEKMDEAQARIDEANDEISDLQDKLSTRARSMYRTGALSFIDLLLGATTFQAFTTNWDILNSMNENDADMVEKTKELKAEVEEQKAEYSAQEAIAAEQADEAKRIKQEAEQLVDEMQATYDSLSAEAEELLRQEEEARAAAEAAAAQAAAEAAAAQAAAEEAAARAAAQAAAQDDDYDYDYGSSYSGTTSSNTYYYDDDDDDDYSYSAPSGSSSYSGGSSSYSGGSSSYSGSSSSYSGSSSSYSSGDSKSQTVTGNVVVDRAYSQLGKPYVWGACGPDSFDCSGLVSYCLTGQYGVRLGTTYTFMGWTRVYDPQPGDICTSSSHCGIYIGGGQMIHAPHTGDVVKVGSVQSGMIYVRY